MRARLLIKCIVGMLVIALLLVGFAAGYSYYALTRIMPTQNQTAIIEVKPNSSATALVNQLYDAKLIDNKYIFLQFIHYRDIASRLKAGVYQIKQNESGIQLINRIVAGEVLTLSFTIIEGMSLEQIKESMAQSPWLNNIEPCDMSLVAKPYEIAEGLLLADTYQYEAGSSACALMLRAKVSLISYLTDVWLHRQADLPYKTPYEMLTAASLLEKETADSSERKLISGVLVNRLNKNMRLQIDPSVIYALGIGFSGKLHHTDLQIDSPYNTYLYKGLPPTPIAMVGKDAIDAAAHPTRSSYLYFVAKGDGLHFFSETYEKHKAAIKRYKLAFEKKS